MNTALIVREVQVLQPAEVKLAAAETTLQLELISPQSKRAYAADTRIFRDWLDTQDITLQEIDYDTMLRYRAYLIEHYAMATAGRRFIVARRLLRVAKLKKLIPENPAENVEFKRSKDGSIPHTALTKREAKRLLAAVDTSTAIGKRDYAILMLMIFAGLRRSELVATVIGDISSKQEHKVLTVQEGKGMKWRDIPLYPATSRAITSYLEAAGRLDDSPQSPLFSRFYKGSKATSLPITDGMLCKIVKRYAAKAKVNATPHDLRATFITLAIDTGSPLIQIQRLAGHASPETTERYYSRKQDLDKSPIYRISLDD